MLRDRVEGRYAQPQLDFGKIDNCLVFKWRIFQLIAPIRVEE
jgi:hypothetical protein